MLRRAHVAPALRRLFLAARRRRRGGAPRLDDFLVVAPEPWRRPIRKPQARGAALRGDLARAINDRLRALAAAGAELGVEVTRVDVDRAAAAGRPSWRSIAVLTATQMADQGVAAARTDAARTEQEADARARPDALPKRHAAAEERHRHRERATPPPVVALDSAWTTPATRPALLDQTYRERIAGDPAAGRRRHRRRLRRRSAG